MVKAVRVRGLREFQRALAKADPELRKQLRGVLRDAGRVVQQDARGRFASVDGVSAAGFRVVVRQRGVAVEQSRRRVTGRRGDYGALQMNRALLPALASNQPQILRGFEQALDRICDLVEG